MDSSHKRMCLHVLVLGVVVIGTGLTLTHQLNSPSRFGAGTLDAFSFRASNADTIGIGKEGNHANLSATGEKHANGWKPPPQVGLLFLTRHGMGSLEPIWMDWFSSCPIDADIIFDIYVHISDKDVKTQVDASSMFHKKNLPKMTPVEWGNHSMVDAERLLFAAALKNEFVQTFVLLSEDSFPLYPALLIYMQLTLEPKSRINVCGDEEDTTKNDRMDHRWVSRMAEVGVTKELWRKSSQWVSLKRDHVAMVLDDEEVNRVFAEECYVAPQRFCVSDEHYIPTLLALKGQHDRCSCDGMAMMTRWTPGAAHPKVFGQSDAKDEIITEELRDGWNPNTTCGTVRSAFLDTWADGRISLTSREDHEEAAWSVLLWEDDNGNHLMTPNCPLFARKLSLDDDTVSAWRQTLSHYLT